MKKNIKTILAATIVAGLSLTHSLAASADDVVERSFNPYKFEQPAENQLTPGLVITAANVDALAKDFLDDGMYKMVKDGWVELTIGETTPIPLSSKYQDATQKNYKGVSLGEEVGQINGYVSGRPFPQEPDLNDPRAGEKLAWNFRYGLFFGDSGRIAPFYWKYRDMESGKVERTMKMEFRAYNWQHRTLEAPLGNVENNPSDIFRTIYMRVDEPYDVKNTQLLIHRYEDDLKRDNAWLYLGFQRRVRRLASGQVTDSFLGSDLMIEDFEGYNGRISDMKWSYKGVKWVLLPIYNHNDQELGEEFATDDGYKYVTFGGKGGCYPNTSWQVRKTYEIEAVPTDPNHPVGKREIYMDSETGALLRINVHDRSDKLWKMWFITQNHFDSHLPRHKDIGVPVYDGFGMMDVQAMHCTTAQMRSEIHPGTFDTKSFTPQYLRVTGR